MLPAAAAAQPDPDEETIVKRPVDPDEEATLLSAQVSISDEAPSSGTGISSARFNGFVYEKAAIDTWHEGHGEDVFDFRTKLNLALDVTRDDMVRAYVSARFSHFAVGETADCPERWYLYNSTSTKYEAEAELGEAFVFVPSDLVNLRIGNQIVRWGFGEVNKPSDVLNPSDLREGLFSDLEVPLVPVFMVHADRTVGPVNFTAVWIPFFNANRANLFGQDWAPASAVSGNPAFASLSGMEQMAGLVSTIAGSAIEDRVQPLLLATDPPEETLQNGQWGGKAQFRVLDVDVAISYFYGWDRLPWVSLISNILGPTFFDDVQTVAAYGQANPEFLRTLTTLDLHDPASMAQMLPLLGGMTDQDKEDFEASMAALNRILFDADGNMKTFDFSNIFETSYRRQQTVGLTWSAILFDTVGFKVDSAFSPSRTLFVENAAGFPSPVSKPTGSYSVGFDYQKSTWFDVLAEFYHFHVFDMGGGEVFLVGNDLYTITMASHLRFLDFDALEIQLAGMVQLPDRGLFAFPKASYKFTDNFKVGAGLLLVEVLPGGDDASPAGLFDRNDSVFAEAKWSF